MFFPPLQSHLMPLWGWHQTHPIPRAYISWDVALYSAGHLASPPAAGGWVCKGPACLHTAPFHSASPSSCSGSDGGNQILFQIPSLPGLLIHWFKKIQLELRTSYWEKKPELGTWLRVHLFVTVLDSSQPCPHHHHMHDAATVLILSLHYASHNFLAAETSSTKVSRLCDKGDRETILVIVTSYCH